jgi:hypothetical protein
MKTTDTHAFVNQFLVWLLVTFCCSGSLGLGLVWMRHQISATANANRKREAQIADLKRRIDETTTKIEGEQSSDVLRRRNADWHLGLAPRAETQVVNVTEDPVLRLAQRQNRDLFTDRAVSVSLHFAGKN